MGYQNSTGVDIFDTAQWMSVGRVTIGSDLYQPSNSMFTVNNIVVALNKNYIVVEAQSAYGTDPLLFAFQDGVRLSNSTTLPISFSYFVKKYIYDSGSNLLFYRTNNQLPINYVQVGASGLTNSTVLASVGASTMLGSGNGFDIYNGKIFSADGGITDVSTKGNVGYIPCNQSPCVTSFEDTVVDPYLKHVLYFGGVGGVNGLQIYDINSKALVSTKSREHLNN